MKTKIKICNDIISRPTWKPLFLVTNRIVSNADIDVFDDDSID